MQPLYLNGYIGLRQLPTYKCPLCRKEYINENTIKDTYKLVTNKNEYINITSDGEKCRLKRINDIAPKYTQINSVKKTPATNSLNCCVYLSEKSKCTQCKINLVETNIIDTKFGDSYTVGFCRHCGIYYLNYDTYLKYKHNWCVLNSYHLTTCKAEREHMRKKDAEINYLAQIQHQYNADTKFANNLTNDIVSIQHQSYNRQKNKELVNLLENRKEKETQKRDTQIQQKIKLKPQAKNILSVNSNHTANLKNEEVFKHTTVIGVTDFIVRRTTFKCMHKKHHLQNIDAKIDIIDQKGLVQHETISAGYCPNCNIFFIMESTYQKLKMKGTPICRTSDEKTYLSGATLKNGMRLAQESILMQYGYNVSQIEGLSSIHRKKILALLVDNNILTRSDLISYLDFFISQRNYQSRFEKAIKKWEDDRDFIENYNTGNYTKYGIHGIIRR